MSANSATYSAFRGAIADFIHNPFHYRESESVRYFPDGLLILEQGQIKAVGDYPTLRSQYPHLHITDYSGKLILPGFIDLHLHCPQTEMIASYGEQLLEWLEKYVFPVEKKFQDPDYAQTLSNFFLDELLRNGTTTAVILTTIFPQSVDALFTAAKERQMRIIAGQMLMSRNAPDFLVNTPQTAYEQTQTLIQKWHHQDRLLYAVTPRFAPTSTPEELELAGSFSEYPDLYIHTHLSENIKEIAWIKELFPQASDYLNVYEEFGLVTERSIFAHGIHLSDSELQRLSERQSAIAFCPTSNLFLGSGLFNLNQTQIQSPPIPVGLATDVGAGTSFSLLKTMGDAYKVMQLQGQALSPFQAFYLSTLGAAKALHLEDKIGNFEPGKEADFIIINPAPTPLMKLRNQNQIPPENLSELVDQLFTLMILGDDRTIEATYILGNLWQSLEQP
ncbi:guanine deaminase [Roseofilum reptotaenium CS-1145]|uniref:Guanine deaminase n=1 Tax=Roseofilum reptotaenium AO1-A TaxID=1925591 RepID=A0A1L9QNA9_9CYAN|nr:guanine deaminase [Roseofilum reptotaenium]MDB9517103.1 guanine deaminase [Roseofilum reptotaenium CS-1145]OJJ24155.1 guanine deaminase [Roseofilum reptotaenium AO1-A]